MQFESFSIDNDKPLVFILGPCALESLDIASRVAEYICLLAAETKARFVFKGSFLKDNRTSYASYRGPGLENGLKILDRIKKDFSLPVITDVHDIGEISAVAEVADVLQIPAFLSRQTRLVETAASTGLPIMIKKGQSLSPSEAYYAFEKAQRAPGSSKIFICERGTAFGYQDVIFDVRGLNFLKSKGCPVIFDASHTAQFGRNYSGEAQGDVHLTPILAKSAVSVGISGIFVETHPSPNNALCDSATQFPLDEIGPLIRQLTALDRFIKAK